MATTLVRSIEEADRKLAEAAAMPEEGDRINFLCNQHLTLDEFPFPYDPFSKTYRDRAVEFWCKLSGRASYVPDDHEKSGYAPQMDVGVVPPFNIRSSYMTGEMLICWGVIIRTLDLKPGQSLLEYGPGSGQILINAARMGIRAAAIDIDGPQIEVIREQAKRLGDLDLRARVGYFGDTVEPGDRYDAVLFFEAFHHAIDHIALVERLHDVVADDGVFAVAGEPVLDRANHFRSVVPYPWGPRLDLLSLRAMKVHGWMELGFQEEYFVRLLHRGGWVVKKHTCPLTERATMFVAKKNTGRVTIGELYLPEDEAETWHGPEGPNRWSRGRGVVTLDSRDKWRHVTVSIGNYNPRTVTVGLTCGTQHVEARIEPGKVVPVKLPLPSATRRLEITSPTFNPQQLRINDDARDLGVFVGEIVYS